MTGCIKEVKEKLKARETEVWDLMDKTMRNELPWAEKEKSEGHNCVGFQVCGQDLSGNPWKVARKTCSVKRWAEDIDLRIICTKMWELRYDNGSRLWEWSIVGELWETPTSRGKEQGTGVSTGIVGLKDLPGLEAGKSEKCEKRIQFQKLGGD